MQKIYDISPVICENTAVFPGDQKFSRKVSLDFKNQDNLLLSAISTTVHIGAHTDAPNHYHPEAEGMSDRSLHYYLGSAQVISVNLARKSRILVEHIKHLKITSKRILFKTNSFPNPNNWNHDFCSLSAEIVDYLAKQGVILVGIDTPSIDLSDDKILESHNRVFKNKMAILEGIVLDQVKDGNYFLISLPLKIQSADASPVRAILLDSNYNFSAEAT